MEYLHYPKSSIKGIKTLITILEPYSSLWSEWVKSGACFLSEKEITVIMSYLISGSHYVSCFKLEISPATARGILNRSKRCLCLELNKYQLWLTVRLLEQHGIIVYESELDRFLYSPLLFLPIPPRLKRKLCFLSKTAMSEILDNYTEKSMSSLKLLDRKSIQEFKMILSQYNCLHLLG
jgi:hypothetical protein